MSRFTGQFGIILVLPNSNLFSSCAHSGMMGPKSCYSSDRRSIRNTLKGVVSTMDQQRASSRWIDNLSRRRALQIGGSGAVAVAVGWLGGTVSPVNAQEATPVAATPTG